MYRKIQQINQRGNVKKPAADPQEAGNKTENRADTGADNHRPAIQLSLGIAFPLEPSPQHSYCVGLTAKNAATTIEQNTKQQIEASPANRRGGQGASHSSRHRCQSKNQSRLKIDSSRS